MQFQPCTARHGKLHIQSYPTLRSFCHVTPTRPVAVQAFNNQHIAIHIRNQQGARVEARDTSVPACQPDPPISTLKPMMPMLPTLMLAALLFLQPAPALAQQDTWVGPARVVDGDTMVIGDQRFRLYGVDAPEKAQECMNGQGAPYACGLVSKDALSQKVGNQTVTCKARNRDQYGRVVAVCSLESIMGSQDLNQWLVDNGLAVAYREYGKDYIPAEDAAKASRKGIWAGTFTYPAQWRKDQKAGVPNPPLPPIMPTPFSAPPAPPTGRTPAASVAQALPEVCGKGVLPIKGNINSKGVKIYHMPGGSNYTQVLVEPEKGEAYFCNEKDAEKAGFRPVAIPAAAASAASAASAAK